MKPILILGLGNPLQGDDGVGCRVAEELQRIVIASRQAAKRSPTRDDEIASSQPFDSASLRSGLPPAMTQWRDEVEVMDGGTPGVGLVNLIEGRARVIIVDAAEMGLAPGEFRRFTTEQITLTGAAQRLSLHRSGVADALALARALELALPNIVFFGVQPARVAWGNALTPRVQAAVPRVVEAILNELK